MILVFTPLAQKDLELIGDYIARDNPRRALTFIREIRQQCKVISSRPMTYRPRSEIGVDIRCCVFGRYSIYFIVSDSRVRIVRILHGAMDIELNLADVDE
jgi:toxin ParE1/3/4